MSAIILARKGGHSRFLFHSAFRSLTSGIAWLHGARKVSLTPIRSTEDRPSSGWPEELDNMDLLQLADLPMGPEPSLFPRDGQSRAAFLLDGNWALSRYCRS